jgi:hypothetical protein
MLGLSNGVNREIFFVVTLPSEPLMPIRPTSGGERKMTFFIFLRAMVDFYVIRISLWRLKRKLANPFKGKQPVAKSVV